GMVPVWQGDTLHQIRARRHVFATGSIEQPLVFAGNDLPGAMLSGGAVRLVDRYAVSPGTRAVIAPTSDRGLDAAARLHDAGIQLIAVARLPPTAGAPTDDLQRRGVSMLQGYTIVAAKGGKQVSQAVLASLAGGPELSFECDLVVMSGGFAPATSLLS